MHPKSRPLIPAAAVKNQTNNPGSRSPSFPTLSRSSSSTSTSSDLLVDSSASPSPASSPRISGTSSSRCSRKLAIPRPTVRMNPSHQKVQVVRVRTASFSAAGRGAGPVGGFYVVLTWKGARESRADQLSLGSTRATRTSCMWGEIGWPRHRCKLVLHAQP